MMQASEDGELHDAEIVAVAIDRLNACVRLEFRLESGQIRRGVFRGVKAFRSEDVTLQNVVSRLIRSSRGQLSREAHEHWMQWVTSLSDTGSWLSAERKREWLDACKDGGMELVVIEPSAGAQIAVVCEQLVLASE
jgi:hypothetical protein